jgi:hypothetical protein
MSDLSYEGEISWLGSKIADHSFLGFRQIAAVWTIESEGKWTISEYYIELLGARGSVVGWGAMLQAKAAP